jgi:hypothetical protein
MGKNNLKRIIMCFIGIVFLVTASFGSEEFIQVFLPDETPITAELALTDLERARGLMYRDAIYADQGMLFVFSVEGYHSFWMKNMNFPIDILWLDEDKRIVHIEEQVPPCQTRDCPSYAPELPGMYVLELKAGMVKCHNLQLQQRIDFVLN